MILLITTPASNAGMMRTNEIFHQKECFQTTLRKPCSLILYDNSAIDLGDNDSTYAANQTNDNVSVTRSFPADRRPLRPVNIAGIAPVVIDIKRNNGSTCIITKRISGSFCEEYVEDKKQNTN